VVGTMTQMLKPQSQVVGVGRIIRWPIGDQTIRTGDARERGICAGAATAMTFTSRHAMKWTG
jgi:hypothetical protein